MPDSADPTHRALLNPVARTRPETREKRLFRHGLLDHFRALGIDSDSVNELETVLHEDGERRRGKLGEGIKLWMGKVLAKTFDRTWDVGTDKAAILLQEALSRFYGWS